MDMKKIELGDKAKDQVTGFKGIVVAITAWLNGCKRIMIQPQKLGEKGETVPTECFDEFQVEVIKKQVVVTVSHETGGPRPSPSQNKAPTR